jgi:hypothetical protein
LDMLQRQDTGTGYTGRSQGQVTEAGHRAKLHKQVTGAVYRAEDRIQRQVTETSQGQVTTHWDKLSIARSQGLLQRRSQGQVTEAGHRNKSQRQVRGKVIGKSQRKIRETKNRKLDMSRSEARE